MGGGYSRLLLEGGLLHLYQEEGERTIGGEVPLGNVGGLGTQHPVNSLAVLAEPNIGVRGKNLLWRVGEDLLSQSGPVINHY